MTSTEIATAYNGSLDPQDGNAKTMDANEVGKVLRRHSQATSRTRDLPAKPG